MSDEITAVESAYRSVRVNRRVHEAQAISHAIFAEISDILPREIYGEVHARITSAILRNGVLLVRDDEREKLGLDPRDAKGWTPSERVKYEQDRVAAMMEVASWPTAKPKDE